MFQSTYSPLYKLNIPKYWFVRDEPIASPYLPEKERKGRENLLFQISSGKYLADLAARLQFFQETIYDRKTPPEMRMLQIRAIKATIEELIYINKYYSIVSKNKK